MNRCIVVLPAIVWVSGPVASQCPTPPATLAFGGWASPSGTVHALVTWDPDGAGPLGPHVVCGGEFAYAGTAVTTNIALFDPITRTFSSLGVGFDAPVRALAVLANGTLVAGGEFERSGATSTAHVAAWNGVAWVGFGGGTDDAVLDLQAMPNGDVVAGGAFTIAGGLVTNHVARWNGIAWSAIAGGVSGTIPISAGVSAGPVVTGVTHLGLRPNGDLVVGGEFVAAGNTAAMGIAIWNGVAWTSPIPGPSANHVAAMHVLGNGDVLICAGNLGGSWFVARWNGATWGQLGTSSYLPRLAFAELANGTLVATGNRQPSSTGGLERWNGSSWSFVDSPPWWSSGVALLEVAPGDLWLATMGGSMVLGSVWRWTGAGWHPPADGLDGLIERVVAHGDGFAIAGSFTQVGSTQARQLAHIATSGAVTSMGGVDGQIEAMAVAANGDLVVGGLLTAVGGVPVNGVARFDGTQWRAMGSPPLHVQALAAEPNGDVIAGGQHFATLLATAARWNGTTWTLLGQPGYLPIINTSAIAVVPNGDVVVGVYGTAGPKVVRWNGALWAPLGNGLASSSAGDFVLALLVLPNGDLVAGGQFTRGRLTNVARWDGVDWRAMGSGIPQVVSDLDLLPDGAVLATHAQLMGTGLPAASPSIWRGNAWTPVSGIKAAGFHGTLWSAVHPQGRTLVTGAFSSVRGIGAGGLAVVDPGCPATAVSYGASCNGGGGSLALAVTSPAWLNSTYRARTSGVAANALAVQVFGLAAANLPLAGVLPQAPPGCTLLASPDVWVPALPVGGVVTASWSLPNLASLLGQSFRQQTVALGFAASGTIQGVSASDAVLVTVGAY